MSECGSSKLPVGSRSIADIGTRLNADPMPLSDMDFFIGMLLAGGIMWAPTLPSPTLDGGSAARLATTFSPSPQHGSAQLPCSLQCPSGSAKPPANRVRFPPGRPDASSRRRTASYTPRVRKKILAQLNALIGDVAAGAPHNGSVPERGTVAGGLPAVGADAPRAARA